MQLANVYWLILAHCEVKMATNVVRIGNVEITALSDGPLEFDLCNFYPSIPAEDWKLYEDALTPEQRIRINVGSFLVRSDGHTVLVDTGLGPDPAFGRENARGELLNDLGEKGIPLDAIDMVVMTHLHRDHVGWNVSSQGEVARPTFPKARYWISTPDWAFFSHPDNLDQFPTTQSCVLPLEELGVLELMDGEHVLTSELKALPTPGHTPGHTCILISSQGQNCLILGDVAHSPVQVHETDWSSRADIDPDQARATRRSLMQRLEVDQTLIASGHFPAPGFGKLASAEGRRYWRAL